MSFNVAREKAPDFPTIEMGVTLKERETYKKAMDLLYTLEYVIPPISPSLVPLILKSRFGVEMHYNDFVKKRVLQTGRLVERIRSEVPFTSFGSGDVAGDLKREIVKSSAFRVHNLLVSRVFSVLKDKRLDDTENVLSKTELIEAVRRPIARVGIGLLSLGSSELIPEDVWDIHIEEAARSVSELAGVSFTLVD